MKIAASILLLLIPIVAVAQNNQGMNEGDMQTRMKTIPVIMS